MLAWFSHTSPKATDGAVRQLGKRGGEEWYGDRLLISLADLPEGDRPGHVGRGGRRPHRHRHAESFPRLPEEGRPHLDLPDVGVLAGVLCGQPPGAEPGTFPAGSARQ